MFMEHSSAILKSLRKFFSGQATLKWERDQEDNVPGNRQEGQLKKKVSQLPRQLE